MIENKDWGFCGTNIFKIFEFNKKSTNFIKVHIKIFDSKKCHICLYWVLMSEIFDIKNHNYLLKTLKQKSLSSLNNS